MGSLKLPHASGNSMSIAAPATNPASDLELKLPATIGSANQFVKNSGTAGTLEFSTLVEDSGVIEVNSPSLTTDAKLLIKGNDTDSHDILTAYSNNSARGSFAIRNGSGITPSFLIGTRGGSESFGLMTNSVETTRIRSNGTIRHRNASNGANTATYNENNSWTSFSGNQVSSYDFKFINQHSSPAATYSVEICAAADVNNTTYRHLNCTKNSNSTGIFVVFGNGNVQNANNSYGQTSDVKLKENIVDANSQWDDIKNLRVRNFNFKADTGYSTHKQIGLIAQEAETISAGLIENVNDVTEDENGTKTETGTVTKQVKYSVLYMKAVKALQEAQTRIETLETKVAALEAT